MLGGFELPPNEILLVNTLLGSGFFIYWFGLYYALNNFITTCKPADFSRRIISILHWISLFILITVLYCPMFQDTERNTALKLENLVLASAWAYNLFDLIWNFCYQTETKLMLANHVIILTTTSLYIFREVLRQVIITGYTLIAATEPILHLRYYLKFYEKDTSIVENIFIATFLMIRVFIFTYLGHQYMSDEHIENTDKLMLLANYVIGLIFVMNIIGYLQRRYQGDECSLGHILRGPNALDPNFRFGDCTDYC